jgi:hypothetical protein
LELYGFYFYWLSLLVELKGLHFLPSQILLKVQIIFTPHLHPPPRRAPHDEFFFIFIPLFAALFFGS